MQGSRAEPGAAQTIRCLVVAGPPQPHSLPWRPGPSRLRARPRPQRPIALRSPEATRPFEGARSCPTLCLWLVFSLSPGSRPRVALCHQQGSAINLAALASIVQGVRGRDPPGARAGAAGLGRRAREASLHRAASHFCPFCPPPGNQQSAMWYLGLGALLDLRVGVEGVPPQPPAHI